MLQTQRQGTVNLGTARAGLVLAVAIAAAAVVGQLFAQNPVSMPAVNSGAGAVSVPAEVPAWATVRDAEVGAFGAATTESAPVVTRNSGGAHKGGFIPQ